jgi:hypothetical protein
MDKYPFCKFVKRFKPQKYREPEILISYGPGLPYRVQFAGAGHYFNTLDKAVNYLRDRGFLTRKECNLLTLEVQKNAFRFYEE